MRKSNKNFNAISVFTELSKILDGSDNEILRLYSEELAQLPFDSDSCMLKLRTLKDEQRLRDNVQNLSSFLSATPMETLLLVALYSVETVRMCSVDICDITRFIGISNLDFLMVRNSLLSLVKKGFIRQMENRHGHVEYRVTGDAERSLLENKPFKVKKLPKIDRYKFCKHISSLIEYRCGENIDTMELFKLVEEEENQNKQLKLIVETRRLITEVADRTLFYEICDDFLSEQQRVTGVESTLYDIYDCQRDRFVVAKDILAKTNILQVNGLIELTPAKFMSEAEIYLSEKGRRLFLEKDFDLFEHKGASDKRLLTPDKIPARKLFFNEKLTAELDSLTNSHEEQSFVELQKRLEQNSLPKGVAVLFHGLPGTGKTAAVDMIAKATGRSVYHVDIAASKTCWFGESEKLFKKIFTDYRLMCETEERKPILLFNEADALFSKRRDVDSRNLAQTENALQNILLEEMETLDGILIATTNMCNNFDSAFERRFLFKVQFGQPDIAAKKAIWRSKLCWLTEEDSNQLAVHYDLSGGEIDNIVRKSLMEEVRTGKHPDLTTLESWCRNEKLNASKTKPIGFAC